MEIIMVDGEGIKKIKCWKIEPSLKSGYIVVDEDYSIALIDIIAIIPERS